MSRGDSVQPSIDEILAQEMAQLGGPLSGMISRRMPNSVGERCLILAATQEAAAETAEAYLRERGRVLEHGVGEVTGVVGGGSMNLNPVHVTVEIAALTDATARIVVRAVAKEGLIKQHAGDSTAAIVAEHLTAVHGELAPGTA